MPRSRMLKQIDDELVQAQQSLRFWRDQATMLADKEFQVAAKKLVTHREAEIMRLLDTQEALLALPGA